MLTFLTVPLILHTIVIQNLKFRYAVTDFGIPCRDQCVRKINKWARIRAPNEINVEIATLLGTYCPELCTKNDSPSSRTTTISKTLNWAGFTSVEKRHMARPIICTKGQLRDGLGLRTECNRTSDVYKIQREWNPCQ